MTVDILIVFNMLLTGFDVSKVETFVFWKKIERP